MDAVLKAMVPEAEKLIKDAHMAAGRLQEKTEELVRFFGELADQTRDEDVHKLLRLARRAVDGAWEPEMMTADIWQCLEEVVNAEEVA